LGSKSVKIGSYSSCLGMKTHLFAGILSSSDANKRP
jgi:hypothetical protein